MAETVPAPQPRPQSSQDYERGLLAAYRPLSNVPTPPKPTLRNELEEEADRRIRS